MQKIFQNPLTIIAWYSLMDLSNCLVLINSASTALIYTRYSSRYRTTFEELLRLTRTPRSNNNQSNTPRSSILVGSAIVLESEDPFLSAIASPQNSSRDNQLDDSPRARSNTQLWVSKRSPHSELKPLCSTPNSLQPVRRQFAIQYITQV